MGETPRIWQVPVYLPYLQPPLTAEAVASAEARLGVRLPAAYLALVREQNGGYVAASLPDSPHSMIWGIGPYFPSITGERAEEMAEGGLVPFDGDGHWHLCLDYRTSGRTGEPSVSYVDDECEHEEPVAADFSSFLGSLRVDRSTWTVGIVGPASLDGTALRLSLALEARFGPADAMSNGYPVRRAAVGAGRNPEWAWLGPNEVPRGFVRPGAHRYAELVNLLPGTALREPEHPEVTMLLSCTEGAVAQVEEACAKAGFTLVSLGGGAGTP
ncbi:hypothetical protein LBMAG42_11960 [Deltaproteobacteria bacterium]|nr:hypothetical protein LBMAG42_11960 [Deltaproteobacteria bacterium]